MMGEQNNLFVAGGGGGGVRKDKDFSVFLRKFKHAAKFQYTILIFKK